MKIIIETPTGEQFNVFFELSDRIEDLNAKLTHKFGVPIDQQCLIFQEQKLEREKIFNDYPIVENSIIKLTYNFKKEIHIIIKTLCKSFFTLDVESKDTIMNIREKIKNKKGLNVSSYDLFYNDIALENEKTLQDYNITDDCIIDINIQINSNIVIKIIQESNESINFGVYPNEKIKFLKNKILAALKYPIDEQFLFFNSKSLDDEKTFQYYGIQDNSKIFLEHRQNIHVIIQLNDGNESKLLAYDVKVTDKIIDFKTRIQKEVKIPIDEQNLYSGNTHLRDFETFKYYQIQNNTVLRFFSWTIYCTTPTIQHTFSINICPDNYIYDVKRKIESKVGYEAYRMFLCHNDKQLIDDMLIKNYPITNWSTIHIMFRYMGG